MPLVRISLRRGKSASYRQAIVDSVYRAMREAFNVPENDGFTIVSEHDEADFDFSTNYLGIARSNNMVVIQITANNTRTVEQKKAFFARVRIARGQSRPAPGRRVHQPDRGGQGELVVRHGYRAVRLTARSAAALRHFEGHRPEAIQKPQTW